MPKVIASRIAVNQDPLVNAEIRDISQFKSPDIGRLTLTVNATSLKLDKLLAKPSGFSSQDKRGTRRDIGQLYQAVNKKSPAQFACIVARTPTTSSRLLEGYAAPSQGLRLNETAVVLVTDLQQIKNDLVIFAGDVQGLAEKRKAYGLETKIIQIGIAELAGKLEQLPREQTPGDHRGTECLRGPYFEARLERSLKPTDVTAIYIDKDDQRAFRKACEIMELKFQMTKRIQTVHTWNDVTVPFVCLL